MNEEQVTLINIGNGAAVELFDAELKRCLENIQDVNTDPEARRTITVQVVLMPDKERSRMDVEIKASSKTAAVKPASTLVYLARRKGQNIAVEHNPQQLALQTPEEPAKFPAPAAPKP